MAELPRLSRALLAGPGTPVRADAPPLELLELPERAVQFGTGAFLRGFVDYFLDAANRQGRFGGRVVAIGSTGSGRDRVLSGQDGLYTLAIEGLDAGRVRQEHRIVASVSRALSARTEWDAVLECARNPELRVVFSNTTEIGIVLDEGDGPALSPPRSFPGKLTRFLLERARAFDYDPAAGVVVVPCELIEDNGDRLREIVLALAERWGVDGRFPAWLREAVPFCNTLVDRIVPGTPEGERLDAHFEAVGYRDELLTACEVYRLFAIQGDDLLRERLGFPDADPGVIVTGDVRPYRERKVRLLNGTHTIMVPLALLCGMEAVREAVEDERVGEFTRRALFEEIVPTLTAPGADAFAEEVLARFANPFIHHALVDITLQQTMKMRVRVVPTILEYAERTGRAPASLALGFAAYLLLLRRDAAELRPDQQADAVRSRWAGVQGDDPAALRALAAAVCSDRELWGADLTAAAGFVEAVGDHLVRVCRDGLPAALDAHLAAPLQER